MAKAKRPVFYVGGGVINSGPEASALLTELVRATGFPITLTLMGLGAFPASDPHFLGMLGMHGTYEANLAMHGCDLMIAVGSRFDDRVTGRLDASRRAPRRSTSTSTRPRSTRTCASTWPWSATPAARSRRCSARLAGQGQRGRPGRGSALVGADRGVAGGTACAIARTARSSSRSTRSSGCTR